MAGERLLAEGQGTNTDLHLLYACKPVRLPCTCAVCGPLVPDALLLSEPPHKKPRVGSLQTRTQKVATGKERSETLARVVVKDLRTLLAEKRRQQGEPGEKTAAGRGAVEPTATLQRATRREPSTMTVAELKAELKKHALATKGRKTDLQRRLSAHLTVLGVPSGVPLPQEAEAAVNQRAEAARAIAPCASFQRALHDVRATMHVPQSWSVLFRQ